MLKIVKKIPESIVQIFLVDDSTAVFNFRLKTSIVYYTFFLINEMEERCYHSVLK